MSTKQNYHKKTILQVVPSLVSGGVERGTLEIAKKIVESGYNSIVISSGGPMVEQLIDDGSKHIAINVASKNPFIIWGNISKISDVIRKFNVDIIHVRSRAPAWSCYIAAKRTNIYLITTFHGIYNFSTRLKKLYNSVMAKGQKIIAVSKFVKEHIVNNYKINPDNIEVIYRGVDHNKFSQKLLSQKTMDSFREKYNVPKNTPVILLPSRMTNWKGQMVLIEALNKIKHLNFYCIMAGDLSKHPSYVERMQEIIHEYKIKNRIQIFGTEANIIGLYSISDIVLSTSIEPEAFGRTIIEAQSMEKLVIATDIGGAMETIQDNITGFHVPAGNASALADKIEYCLGILGSKEAEEITKKARKSTIDNFSLEVMLEKTMNIYNTVLENNNS